jgi:hypothetical protein
VSGSVDEWSDELEEDEVDEGEGREGRTVGVGEDVEEELGREARQVQGSIRGRVEGGGGHERDEQDWLAMA